jgi:hypothetical protein
MLKHLKRFELAHCVVHFTYMLLNVSMVKLLSLADIVWYFNHDSYMSVEIYGWIYKKCSYNILKDFSNGHFKHLLVILSKYLAEHVLNINFHYIEIIEILILFTLSI